MAQEAFFTLGNWVAKWKAVVLVADRFARSGVNPVTSNVISDRSLNFVWSVEKYRVERLPNYFRIMKLGCRPSSTL
jgi:hypothetical protein